ncbi:MAG: hypothetical protein IPJ76_05730 [Flavobacteriales bacterium]|nr:MAG: hypothetical protein IPJ76_05730 [Flavobacteriales bacterium]
MTPGHFYWYWLPHPLTVQFITFPLLLVGLLCVLLELRAPQVVRRAERWIRTSRRRLGNTALHHGLSGFRRGQAAPEARLGAYFLLVVTGVFQLLYFIIMVKSVSALLISWAVLSALGLLGLRFSGHREELVRLACLVLVMATCLQLVSVHLLARVLCTVATRLLAWFDASGGRAVGRVGLGLAACGLVGEAYQQLWLSHMAYWLVLAAVPVLLGLCFALLAALFKRRPAPQHPGEQHWVEEVGV